MTNARAAAAGFHAAAIGIGEIGVAGDGAVLRTFVGSCVGLVLFDGRRRIAGLAHIVLPESHGVGEPCGKYADTAIPEMIRRLDAVASGGPLRLAAKVGGARMFAFPAGLAIGDQNVAAVERILAARGIPLLSRDCGGDRGRRASFDVATGVLQVETLGMPPISI